MRKGRPKLVALHPDDAWVEASRRVGEYPAATERSGKWLCFIDQQDADRMWGLVAVATRDGLLGSHSDMGPPRTGSGGQVIEVHTYDWTDADDVHRIREELRRIGFVNAIPYKADADTAAGIYKETGHKRISKYFE